MSKQLDTVIGFSPFYASVPLLKHSENYSSRCSCSLSLYFRYTPLSLLLTVILPIESVFLFSEN